jgi:hypothetical protein
MAFPLRIEHPGAVCRITSRGNEKKAVFIDETDRVRATRASISLTKKKKL